MNLPIGTLLQGGKYEIKRFTQVSDLEFKPFEHTL